MTARYVYWRSPDGRPYRSVDEKNAPHELLAEFGRLTNVDASGNLSWSGFTTEPILTAIRLAAVVMCPNGDELNETDAWWVVRSAMHDVARHKGAKQPLDAQAVIRAADSRAAEYFRRPDDEYTLVTSLSVKSLPFRRSGSAGCKIVPLVSRRGYPYPKDIRFRVSPAIVRHIDSSKYRIIGVRTTSKSAYAAADNAFRALNALRGIWDLLHTARTWRVVFGATHPEPIGPIQTGPIHTLHLADKTVFEQCYWYERFAAEDRKLFDPRGGWAKTERNRRWVMRRLCVHPFRRDLEDLLVRYAVALDQADHDVAFLQLWGILERLTNTVGAHYDETARRAAWWNPDRSFVKRLVECVRLQRNLYVHAARSCDEPDQVAYLTKSLVDPHLFCLIRNDFAVSSLEEYGNHLSLPTDLAVLRRNRRWLTRTIHMLESRAKKTAPST